MKVLVHGYGLLSEDRRSIIAGSKMSGLTLYNSILCEGLERYFTVSFLCGRLSPVCEVVEKRRAFSDGYVFEYDARFSDYLEKNGKFIPELSMLWYCDRVDAPGNPIYSCLSTIYEIALDYFCPDIVSLHNLNAAVAYVYLRQQRRKEIPAAIVTVHDTNRKQLGFVARNKSCFYKFVAISNAVINELLNVGIEFEQIEHISNGLPLSRFFDLDSTSWNSIAQRNGIPIDDTFQILVPTRRVPGKGIEYAIKAFKEFHKQAPVPSRLIISGFGMTDPAYEAWLRDFSNQLECSNSIFFLGQVSYAEMPSVFAACDVSLVPSSIREGFCYANLEAMATGGPVVITTKQGGCLDYITHKKNGIFVLPEDHTSITKELLWLTEQPHLAAGLRNKARQTAERYTADLMIKKYANLLKRAVRKEMAL